VTNVMGSFRDCGNAHKNGKICRVDGVGVKTPAFPTYSNGFQIVRETVLILPVSNEVKDVNYAAPQHDAFDGMFDDE
jgi:hypothetical protein